MPIQGTTQFSQLLTDVSVRFKNDEYIADAVFPAVNVVKDTDRIAVYGSENLRLSQTLRGNKSVANQATFSVSNTTYQLSYHALRDVVTQRDRDNYDPPIQADVDVTEFLTDQILLRREYDCATVAFTTTSWGTGDTLTSATSWRYNTTGSVDPSSNAFSASSSILLRSGKRANQCVMGYGAYDLLRNNVFVMDKIKYTQLGVVTPGLIAALFDIDRLVVGTAVRDAGIDGISSSNTSVWDASHALFMYVPAASGLKVVSAGYMLNKTVPYETRTWKDEAIKGDWIEVETAYQFKPLATAAAFLFTGVNV